MTITPYMPQELVNRLATFLPEGSIPHDPNSDDQLEEVDQALFDNAVNGASNLPKAIDAATSEVCKIEGIHPKGVFLYTLTGHTDRVVSIAFSRCGKYVVSGSYDNTLKIWNVDTGTCLYTLTGHTNSVTSVAFSPCRKYVISGSYDKTLKIWDVDTGRCLNTLMEHTDPVQSVAFSPCGKYVISGSHDKTLKIWDVDTGRCLNTLTQHTKRIESIAFSPCGKYVVAVSDENMVNIWSLYSLELFETNIKVHIILPKIIQYLENGGSESSPIYSAIKLDLDESTSRLEVLGKEAAELQAILRLHKKKKTTFTCNVS